MLIHPQRLVARALFALCIAATGAAAQQIPTSGSQQGTARPPVKGKKLTRVRKPESVGAPMSSGNLNAPAMDFSHAEPEIDDPGKPRDRGQRSNVHPSIDSSGRPAMGLGF